MARRKRKNRNVWKNSLALVIVMLFMCIGIFLWINMIMEPNLEEVSKLKAESIVSRAVNEALTEQFQNEDNPESLFLIKKDENGKTELVQADSIAINVMMTQLSGNLQKAFENMGQHSLEIPVGALFGSKILSQAGPSVNVDVVPLNVLSTDFKTEFESQAINQTKYKIYIILKCRVKVLAPFCSRTFDTSSIILLAEAVILGEVPNSFVQVPEADILDVTEQ